MSIGQRIHQIRTQKGISQGDIQRSTGMRRGYVSRVEHGQTIPSLETLQRFAAALDVPMYRFLCTAQDEVTPSTAGGPFPGSPEELAQGAGSEGADARFLLQLKPLVAKIVESDPPELGTQGRCPLNGRQASLALPRFGYGENGALQQRQVVK